MLRARQQETGQEVAQGLRCTGAHTGHLTGDGDVQHHGPWLGPVALLGMRPQCHCASLLRAGASFQAQM